MSAISASQFKPFADFVQTTQKQSTSYVLAVTRSQATTQKKLRYQAQVTSTQRRYNQSDDGESLSLQDEELKWLNLKTVLRGNSDKLKYRAARDAWKIAERFLLTDDNVLYYMHSSPRNQQDNQEELRLRLVVPTTMIQEGL
ncbi:hypothetical protein PHMEG_00010467 [Phytophthora megakarya]|uniref:Reverse transcriptase n=1 Tax=Phytophthora megakarya TaxID=4795 RepID=A0A225WG31_9STRA|nr:hypothetical protein PHMEG_00010467 [Phytophthora megakarya]